MYLDIVCTFCMNGMSHTSKNKRTKHARSKVKAGGQVFGLPSVAPSSLGPAAGFLAPGLVSGGRCQRPSGKRSCSAHRQACTRVNTTDL